MLTVCDRERWLAEALVGLADTLVADFDVGRFASTLASRLAQLLGASEVGVVMADRPGAPELVAASSDRTRQLLDLQGEEGPCWDCYRSGRQILNVDLDDPDDPWPTFALMATTMGVRVVHAFPMRWRNEVIGVVNVFHSTKRSLSASEIRLAQALTDMATIGIMQQRARRRLTDLSQQLQGALSSRIVIEQAKGIVAERLSVDMDTAFSLIRSHARGNNVHLSDVVQGVVDRSLPVEEICSRQSRR